MNGNISKASLSERTRKFAAKIVELLSTSYGIVDFVSGPPLRRRLGSMIAIAHDGGVCVRSFSDSKAEVLCRIAVSYPVSLKAVGEIAHQMIYYAARSHGFTLKHVEIIVEAMR